MSPFVGQRVELTGTVAPATPSAAASASSATGTPAPPEFHVVSVRPIAGSCSPR
jgi:hypothetical protein